MTMTTPGKGPPPPGRPPPVGFSSRLPCQKCAPRAPTADTNRKNTSPAPRSRRRKWTERRRHGGWAGGYASPAGLHGGGPGGRRHPGPSPGPAGGPAAPPSGPGGGVASGTVVGEAVAHAVSSEDVAGV